MTKKILFFILTFCLLSILFACKSKPKVLEGTSEEFSKDIYDLAKVVEKDIKNYTNESSVLSVEGEGSKFIEKYKNKEDLTETEKGYIELIKEAIFERDNEFFFSDKKIGEKFNEESNKKCLELLEFIDFK